MSIIKSIVFACLTVQGEVKSKRKQKQYEALPKRAPKENKIEKKRLSAHNTTHITG